MREARLGFAFSVFLLIAIPAILAAYKIAGGLYTVDSVVPRTRYDVVIRMKLDGQARDVSVKTFLPRSDSRQTVQGEENRAPGFRLSTDQHSLNRVATWTGDEVPDATGLEYRFSVLSREVRFEIDPRLEVPGSYPASVARYLRPEDEIQVDADEIGARLHEIGADRGDIKARLQKIYDTTRGLTSRPFKGTTDALTALRLGEASCNGKSRLFVALARATGIPARLVGGLVMNPGSKRTSHQWVEAYVAGHWVPFDPTNHHFASLPEHYLVLYTGDHALFTHTSDINFDYRFSIQETLVSSDATRQVLGRFNVLAMFERLHLPLSLLHTLLMLPIGALVVVLFRNVIGVPTYGTFLPALIAASAGETGALWGLVGLVIVVLIATLVRTLVRSLELLHSPTLAILLAAVTIAMLITTMAAENAGFVHLTRVSLFPIAVLAITTERFYLSLTEDGPAEAFKFLTGTSVVILGCYVVMNSLALQIVVIAFPEVLLVVIALDMLLGRWVGMRVSEYIRFRHLLRSPEPPGGTP
jgi:transglutaminase-like putative cysteine protease